MKILLWMEYKPHACDVALQLHRRYGHKLAPIPPTPDPELADSASDVHESEAAGAAVLGRSQEDGGGGCSSFAGNSPQTDPGSSMTGTSGASPPANLPGGRARTGPKVCSSGSLSF